MPTVTFLGPNMWKRRSDKTGQWERAEPVEVSQEWLNHWRARLSPRDFRIEGDAGVTVDFGNDGIPDSGWTKKDITTWITSNGGEVSGYNTKNKLLGMVDTILNPPAPEPVVEEVTPEPEVVEEAVPEPEVVEETIVEEAVSESIGVEE